MSGAHGARVGRTKSRGACLGSTVAIADDVASRHVGQSGEEVVFALLVRFGIRCRLSTD